VHCITATQQRRVWTELKTNISTAAKR